MTSPKESPSFLIGFLQLVLVSLGFSPRTAYVRREDIVGFSNGEWGIHMLSRKRGFLID